ncbi:hypothetical protein HYQ46_009536 [Verticillium longisporum]|nr:hypothetical protein HYQ46_009536 [Verticillium longisporum]
MVSNESGAAQCILVQAVGKMISNESGVAQCILHLPPPSSPLFTPKAVGLWCSHFLYCIKNRLRQDVPLTLVCGSHAPGS